MHFIFSGTEKATGGGTTLWKLLLSSPPQKVWLHYSSYAASLWKDIQHPHLYHVVHEGWKTYERAPTPFPWKNRDGFDMSFFQKGDVVIFDGREALQQLAIPLAKQGALLFWHMQSEEQVFS